MIFLFSYKIYKFDKIMQHFLLIFFFRARLSRQRINFLKSRNTFLSLYIQMYLINNRDNDYIKDECNAG